MGARKLVATAICLILISVPAIAAQDAADAATEAAAGYLGTVYVLLAVKKTQCGYALLMDVENLSRKAEQDVLKTLPPKYRKDVPDFISTLKQKSPGLVAKSIKDLEGKFDDKTRCGLVVGGAIGIHTEYWKAWERAKEKL